MDIHKYLSQFPINTENSSLDGIKWIMDKFDNPHKKCRIIHIAGTNGKASVLEMINNILQIQGYRVGKYISPHLISFNERICINNVQISNEEIDGIINEMKYFFQKYDETHNIQIKYFDIITSVALIYFARKNCDIILLETGLGGMLDSTNIVNPLFSIITSIGFDHMKVLGNTLVEIAQNKAGIIKPYKDTIFLELENKKENNEVLAVIQEKCSKENNKLHIVERRQITKYEYDEKYQYFDYNEYKNMSIKLKGKIQVFNAAIAIKATQLLKEKGYKILKSSIKQGLKTAINPARFEVISENPIIIYDGAHNMPAIQNFMANMKQYYENREKVYIISILKKKDYNTIIKCLAEDRNAIFYVTDGNDKILNVSKEELYNIGSKYIKKGNIEKMDLQTAIKVAIQKYPNRVIGIVGSFYIYGDVMEQVNTLIKK